MFLFCGIFYVIFMESVMYFLRVLFYRVFIIFFLNLYNGCF